MEDNTKAILNKAADLLEQGFLKGRLAADSRGRTTGATSPDATAFCSIGAIIAAESRLGIAGRKTRCVSALVEGFLGLEPYGIVEWNNDPERTQDEVVTAFRKAARSC